MKPVLSISFDSMEELRVYILSGQGAAALAAGLTVVGMAAAPAIPSGEDDDNATPNAAAPAVDAAGLPWDERIHASSKGLTDKGLWRKKKGADANLITAVEAELRARAGVPATAVVSAPTSAVPLPPGLAPSAPAVQMPAPAAVSVPAMPAPQTVPAMPQTTAPAVQMPQQPARQWTPQASPLPGDHLDFNNFMGLYSQIVQAGLIDASYAADVAKLFGLGTLMETNTAPHHIPNIIARFRADGKVQ